jgi:hypothetical protein
MAWRCSGKTNAELIANLAKNGIFHYDCIAAVSAHYFTNESERYR